MKNIIHLIFICMSIFIITCTVNTTAIEKDNMSSNQIKNINNSKGKNMNKNKNLVTDETMKINELTKEEEYVLLQCGTEMPFSGELLYNKDDGLYTCKRCDNVLFTSNTKFDSMSGWPSFDEAVEGSVAYHKDPDGMRTEIVCAKCGGHLGHVFYNEGFTDKNARYCVNSLSLNFEVEQK